MMAMFLLGSVMYVMVACVVGLLWDYGISTILVEGFGKPDTFQYWHGLLLGLVPGLGQVGVFVALGAFLFSFFV